MSTTLTEDLATFQERADALVREHPVVTGNAYTRWFATGTATLDEVRHLTVQFSVFSHLFLEAQLRKVHQRTRRSTSYRAGKEILLNELGVVFRPVAGRSGGAGGVDPELVATEGTIEGGRFRFAAAHFEWLLRFAGPLGLEFDDLGNAGRTARPRRCASATSCCASTARRTRRSARARRYAVEHWAAAGFWKELIAGLEAFKARECPELPLAFWTWHDKVEDQHAAHTDDELADGYRLPGFDEERFLAGAARMLDGVEAFWDGLEADRLAGVAARR